MKPILCTCLVGSLLSAGATMAQANSFIDDSKVSLRYSNYYWNEDKDDAPIGVIRDEWVHAARVSFNSGYYQDVFAFDYTFGAAGDLDVGDDATSITNLSANTSVQDPHGIAGTMEAYAKFRLLNTEDQSLNLGYGKKTRKRLQYQDNTTRILPASTIGFDADYKFGDLNLYYTHINKFSPRNESTWGDSLTNASGDVIDNLQIFGLGYVLPNGTKLDLEYAESEDYLKSTLAKVSHKFKLDDSSALDLSASYGRQEDAGDLFGTDHKATFVDLQSKYSIGNYYIGLAYNQVSDGNFDEVFFAKDHGHFASSAKIFYMFGLEDEDTLKLSAGMNFGDFGIPQMRWDMHYAFSDGAKAVSDLERSELQSVLQYRFDGALKGLHLAWLHTEFDTDYSGAPYVFGDSGLISPAATIDHHADRFYLNYTYNF